jgi:hypothetical protein
MGNSLVRLVLSEVEGLVLSIVEGRTKELVSNVDIF